MTATTHSSLSVDLRDQVAIVTGASRGIGQAIAMRLAGCGARVACVARDAARLSTVVNEIRQAGGDAESFPADVTDSDSVARVVEAVVQRWEKLHILVNNAGLTRDTLIPRMSDEQWDDVLATNLRGAFLFTRAVCRPLMQGRYGRIVNIASVSGLVGNAGQANYAASKAGLIGMSRAVSKELASRNITVNVVAPGFVESDMTAALGTGALDEIRKRLPLKRLGHPGEIADAVLFLASPAAGYITGQVLTVDGGLTS